METMPIISVIGGVPELKDQDQKIQESTSEQSVKEIYEYDNLSYYEFANTISATLIC